MFRRTFGRTFVPRIFSTQDKEQLKLWDLLQKEDNSPTKQQASEHPDESDSAETVSVSSDSTIDDFITQIDGLNLVSPSIKQETDPILFDDYQFVQPVKKIGEATFSDVYSMPKDSQTVALKVIPVDGPDNDQLSLIDAAHEIMMTKAVGSIKQTMHGNCNFVRVFDVCLCKGPYNKILKNAWDAYDEMKGSENVPPDEYEVDQVYIIMVLSNGGCDLEHTKLIKKHGHVKSLLMQVAISLSQAEQQLEFEHRDLHWGNILLDNCVEDEFDYNIDGKSIKVLTNGVKATIIDFTLSRIKQKGGTMYLDLEQDPEYFTGPGENEEDGDLQFDIYRRARDIVQKDWSIFEPRTNVEWMYYLVDKIIKFPDMKSSKLLFQSLKALLSRIRSYNSMKDFVATEICGSSIKGYLTISAIEE